MRIRERLTYANIAATLALLVAISGGAYAAASIDGGDVENGSLTGKDIKTKSVPSKDLKGLDWDKLTDVPNGFADDVDDEGAGGQAYTASLVGPLPVPEDPTPDQDPEPMATVELPPGDYAVFAKLWLQPPQGETGRLTVECELSVEGADVDQTNYANDGAFEAGSVPMNILASLPDGGEVIVACNDERGAGNPAEYHDLRVTALEISGLNIVSVTPLTGP